VNIIRNFHVDAASFNDYIFKRNASAMKTPTFFMSLD
jgi:hypothetical protein